MTREIDAKVSIDKKARDVKKLIADATKQVPADRPSVIHIAVETLDGPEVEERRTEKIMTSIPSFVTDKPVKVVRLHRFQANQTIDKLWEFDETVETFQTTDAVLDNLPSRVVVPDDVEVVHGRHWEVYRTP